MRERTRHAVEERTARSKEESGQRPGCGIDSWVTGRHVGAIAIVEVIHLEAAKQLCQREAG